MLTCVGANLPFTHGNEWKDERPMALTKEQKQSIMADHKVSDSDTGSASVQIAMLSKRIKDLTEHLKTNKKDYACVRGLTMLVGRRRRLLRYYKRKHSAQQYQELIQALNIRK